MTLLLNLFLPSFALAQAFGRIGCFLGGCCYGRPAKFLGVSYPEGSLPYIHHGSTPLIPVQLYESAYLLITFVILFKVIRFNHRGAWYLILMPAGRFWLEFCRNERMKRNRDIFLKLHFLGYDLNIGMEEFCGKDLLEIGRPHFARALVNRYGFTTIQSCFDKLLGHNKPAWVKRKYPLPEEVINAIHLAGGVAVWAHPISRDVPDKAFLIRTVRRLKKMGLDGIEAYYSMFSGRETALISEVAEQYGLMLSGGSDFHGENRPNILLGFGSGGLRVPEELFFLLKSAVVSR